MLWRSSKRRSALPAGFIEPCIPTVAARPPAGSDWIHEVKQDGYRMIAKVGDGVQLFTRSGFDWTKRYPRIVAAMEWLRVKSATIDGEGVWLAENGIGDFRKLHSRTVDGEVSLFAFDLLELNGDDIRKQPLGSRRELLRALLMGADIQFSDCFEADGSALFAQACKFGLEGIVSKRRDLAYQSGKSTRWLKIKNPQSPAVLRLIDGTHE
jgi:bifunctional non-homologous end joining protein LigD